MARPDRESGNPTDTPVALFSRAERLGHVTMEGGRAMRKSCAGCGDAFDAKRAAAKFCGARCRQRAHRRPAAKVVALVVPDAAEGSMAAATRRGLESVGRMESELGAGAMLLAARLDQIALLETGAGLAALMREYRATLADAVKDAAHADDELDEIRGSAALKLIAGGA